MPACSAAAISDLAPTGKLRAAINFGNNLLTAKDPATGEPRGIAVDLARELGRRLGVPVEIVGYDSPGALADAVKTGVWDVGFIGAEPPRAKEITFTPAYVETPKTRDAGAECLREFVADIKATGLVARTIEKNGIRAVSVAAAASFRQ